MKIKTQIMIYSFASLVFILLTFYIFFDSKQYDCSQCVVTFKSKGPLEKDYSREFNITPEEIIVGFLENKCVVSWDENQGFYKSG